MDGVELISDTEAIMQARGFLNPAEFTLLRDRNQVITRRRRQLLANLSAARVAKTQAIDTETQALLFLEATIHATHAKLQRGEEISALEQSETQQKEAHVARRKHHIAQATPVLSHLQYEVAIAHPSHPFNYRELPADSQSDTQSETDVSMDITFDPTKRSKSGADTVDK